MRIDSNPAILDDTVIEDGVFAVCKVDLVPITLGWRTGITIVVGIPTIGVILNGGEDNLLAFCAIGDQGSVNDKRSIPDKLYHCLWFDGQGHTLLHGHKTTRAKVYRV